MSKDEKDTLRQQKVIVYVNKLHEVLLGCDEEEAQTAIALLAASMIVALSDTEADRQELYLGLGKSVRDFIRREDMVEWIKDGVNWVQRGHA